MAIIKTLGVATLIAALGMSSAYAVAPTDRVFVGLDIQAVELGLDKDVERWTMDGSNSFLKTNLTGASIFGGYRWQQLAFEIGITGIRQVKYVGSAQSGSTTIVNASLDQKNYNTYLDVLYFYPLASNIELKGLVGLGVLTSEFEGNISVSDSGDIASVSGSSSESRAGLRLGLGAQYNFTNHWSTSLMYKYQWGNDYFKSMQALALGVAYSF